MQVMEILTSRSGSKCELCASNSQLAVYEISDSTAPSADHSILACANCIEQLSDSNSFDHKHWHCLNDSIWNENSPVKVISWRILNYLRQETWAQNLLDQIYLTEEELVWAKDRVLFAPNKVESSQPKDSNGNILQDGDTVTLIKDLEVKGAGFTAKRGTVVKKISLTDNPTQIEGRVDGVRIVLLTQYLKKVGKD
ncbi:MAG: PhnA domain-containing protein [Bdellovibrionales bacterium]|nr:PhnA domain-containing protein [Bdellovibrionales bacterium]